MLINLPKLEAEELELMFIQDDEDENEEIDEFGEEEAEDKPKLSKIRQETFAATQSAYQ